MTRLSLPVREIDRLGGWAFRDCGRSGLTYLGDDRLLEPNLTEPRTGRRTRLFSLHSSILPTRQETIVPVPTQSTPDPFRPLRFPPTPLSRPFTLILTKKTKNKKLPQSENNEFELTLPR